MVEDVSLFQEIDEALRADKVSQFWEKNSGTVITFCVLLVLSTAASAFWRSHMRDVHMHQSGQLAQASILADAGNFPDAIAIFTQIEKEGGPIAPLAGLRHAQALIATKQDDKAIPIYNDLASGRLGDASDAVRDYAALEADILAHNMAQASGKPPVKTEGAEVARQSGRTFAAMFAEMDALRGTDSKKTLELLDTIIADKDAPYSERRRAVELSQSLKGSAK